MLGHAIAGHRLLHCGGVVSCGLGTSASSLAAPVRAGTAPTDLFAMMSSPHRLVMGHKDPGAAQPTMRGTFRAAVLGRLASAGLVWIVGSSCRNTVAPDDVGGTTPDVVVTTGAFPGELVITDGFTRRISRRIALDGAVEELVAAPEGRTIYAGIVGAGFRRSLAAVDVRTATSLWSLPLSENGQPSVIDGIGLLTGEVLAVSPDGRRLYMARAVRSGVGGIAVLDLTSKRPVLFDGPWSVAAGGIVPLAINTTVPLLRDGALAVVASRQNSAGGGPRRGEKVYLLAPGTLAVLDSIAPDVLGGSATQEIWQVVASPDGRRLYVAGSERIVQFDLATRRVEASVARPSLGAISVAADGSTVVVTDAGRFPDTPGSGLLFTYGSDLVPRGTIDVSSPLGAVPRSPSAIATGIALSQRSGHLMYVRAGTPSIGPLYPVQPARLLLVDPVERRVTQTLETGGNGLGPIALGSP